MLPLENIKKTRQELHDLNNQLTVVVGYIDMVLGESEEISTKNIERLEHVDKATVKMAEAIRNSFDLLPIPEEE